MVNNPLPPAQELRTRWSRRRKEGLFPYPGVILERTRAALESERTRDPPESWSADGQSERTRARRNPRYAAIDERTRHRNARHRAGRLSGRRRTSPSRAASERTQKAPQESFGMRRSMKGPADRDGPRRAGIRGAASERTRAAWHSNGPELRSAASERTLSCWNVAWRWGADPVHGVGARGRRSERTPGMRARVSA
jgi:hypothetical protein